MKISDENKEKISEQILAFLYLSFPKAFFTKQIAKEIIRDEEFVKKLLFDLKRKNLIFEITKNPKGKKYLKRARWKISNAAYEIYRKKQH